MPKRAKITPSIQKLLDCSEYGPLCHIMTFLEASECLWSACRVCRAFRSACERSWGIRMAWDLVDLPNKAPSEKLLKKFLQLRHFRESGSIDGWNDLFQACARTGQAVATKILLGHRMVDPSSNCSSALHLACIYRHEEIFAMLLRDKRADPSSLGNLPLVFGCSIGNERIVRMLQEDGRVDESYDNHRAMRLALKHGNGKIIKMLLNHEQSQKRAIGK